MLSTFVSDFGPRSAVTSSLISCGRRALIFLIFPFLILLASLSRISYTEFLIFGEMPRLNFLPTYFLVVGLNCSIRYCYALKHALVGCHDDRVWFCRSFVLA